MRSPFSLSKSSLFKRTSSSSSSEASVPSSQASVSSDAYEKISVASEAPPSTFQRRASPVPTYPNLPSPRTTPSASPYRSPPPSAQDSAPRCRGCSKPCVYLITRSSNRNGNAGRPYYKCQPCDKFACFADSRGESEGNPICHCGVSSKRQLSSPQKGRKMFYSCSTGGCDFFQFHMRSDGKPWAVKDDIADAFAEVGII